MTKEEAERAANRMMEIALAFNEDRLEDVMSSEEAQEHRRKMRQIAEARRNGERRARELWIQ